MADRLDVLQDELERLDAEIEKAQTPTELDQLIEERSCLRASLVEVRHQLGLAAIRQMAREARRRAAVAEWPTLDAAEYRRKLEDGELPAPIVVSVTGGVVDVQDVPAGVVVELRDYDVTEHESGPGYWTEVEDGKPVKVSVWGAR